MLSTVELARLTSNPFTLVAGRKVTIWAGYEEVKKELLDVIDSCRSDRVGLSEFVVIHGEYGTGKSHDLRYLQYYITEAHKDEFQSPVVYLESTKLAAKMDFMAIYRRIVELLRDHIVVTARRLDRAIEIKARQALSASALSDDIQQQKRLLYQNHNSEITPSFPSLTLLLKDIKEKEGKSVAMSILTGNKEKDLAAFNLTSPIDTEYDCVKCLSAYINLCTHPNRDYLVEDEFPANKAFYLFIDEIEQMQDMKPAEVLSINQGIRDLINSLPENFCLIFGVSGDPRRLFAIFDQPVVRRWSREPIELQLMNNDQAVAFLKEVLRGYRADPSDPDEYPFREAALRKIAEETTSKTAEKLFRSCRRVLEKAVLSGRLQPGGWIEVEDVQEFLQYI